jgi:starch phosphorylase
LLQYINQKSGVSWKENELLLGWARRIVRYKRPLALFGEIEPFLNLARDEARPVHVVLAGIAHQADTEGRELISRIQELVTNELNGTVVYLPDYNQTLAKLLISGCDVWLNNPVVGSEACGTSWMKASLNGVLPLSTKDGWMAEVDINSFGWEVENENVQTSLLKRLAENVIPAYYSQDKTTWHQLQENGKALIRNEFCATRMLRDYFEKAYLPILRTSYAHYE